MNNVTSVCIFIDRDLLKPWPNEPNIVQHHPTLLDATILDVVGRGGQTDPT